MASKSDEPEPPKPAEKDARSFKVDHHENVEGYYLQLAHDQRRRKWQVDSSAPLDLASPAHRAAAPVAETLRKRKPLSRRALALALAGIAAAFLLPLALVGAHRLWVARRSGPARASGLVIIDSTPSNARLFVDGKEVGRTPWVAPNTYAPGTVVPIRIVYPGAQEWSGTFAGGVASTINAELQAQ